MTPEEALGVVFIINQLEASVNQQKKGGMTDTVCYSQKQIGKITKFLKTLIPYDKAKKFLNN